MLQMSNFINVVAEGETPEVSTDDELESVLAIETAYRSLLTGQYLNIHPAVEQSASSRGERKFSVLSSRKV